MALGAESAVALRPRRGGSGVELVQRLLEAVGVAALGLGEGFEPVGNLVEALVPGGFRHAGVHVGVLVGLAGDGGLEVVGGAANGQAGGGIAHRLQVFQVAVGVAGLTFGGGAEHGGHVVVALDIGLGGEIEIAAVGL